MKQLADQVNVQVFVYTNKTELLFLLLKRTSERCGYWQPVQYNLIAFEKLMQIIKS